MSIKTFSSIYIGSFEVTMKIFEISSKKKLREIDYIRSRLDLGKEAYKHDNKSIGYECVDELRLTHMRYMLLHFLIPFQIKCLY